MAWDSVPWFVGGGAEHSPEVARLLAYASTSGAEGVVTPGDLKVVPLAVPGTSIRVLKGAGLILNRSAAGAQQTYVARNPSEDVKGVTSTGSSGPRYDLVVAQIKDPFLAGEPWADPANPKVGPYIFTEIIPNVGASVVESNTSARAYLTQRGLSAIPLAGLLIPASTATITDAHIRDLRNLALPRSSNELGSVGFADGEWFNAVDTENFKTWPGPAFSVLIPTWATHMNARVDFSGILRTNGSIGAAIRARLGDIHTAGDLIVEYDAGPGAAEEARESFFVTAGSFIPENRRGTIVQVATEARRLFTNAYPGYLRSAGGGQMAWDVRFYERVV